MNRFFAVLLLGTCSAGMLCAQATKPEPPKKLTPADARTAVGRYVTIVGKVFQVRTVERATHINFGGAYPYQDFAAVVFASRTNLFPNLDKLPGQTVEVTGRVEEYNGKPQIILQAKTQLKIAVEKDTDPSDGKDAKIDKPKTVP
jgi:hypothetical protein